MMRLQQLGRVRFRVRAEDRVGDRVSDSVRFGDKCGVWVGVAVRARVEHLKHVADYSMRVSAGLPHLREEE
eukprot:6349489-Pyramimonas_sp.AAC.1